MTHKNSIKNKKTATTKSLQRLRIHFTIYSSLSSKNPNFAIVLRVDAIGDTLNHGINCKIIVILNLMDFLHNLSTTCAINKIIPKTMDTIKIMSRVMGNFPSVKKIFSKIKFTNYIIPYYVKMSKSHLLN